MPKADVLHACSKKIKRMQRYRAVCGKNVARWFCAKHIHDVECPECRRRLGLAGRKEN